MKPGYYVNIVWLKSRVLHNWLHTQNIHAHARAHIACKRTHIPFRFYLFRFLVIRVGKNIEYIGTLLSSHTHSHTQSFTLSFVLGHLDVMFGKFVAKMRIRLLTLLCSSHRLTFSSILSCSLSFIHSFIHLEHQAMLYTCTLYVGCWCGPDYIIHTEHNYSMNCFPIKRSRGKKTG